MKKIKMVVCVIYSLLTPLVSYGEDNSYDKQDVEIFDNNPNKPYSIISPVSADKDSLDGAFKTLKEKSIKLGADAIINLKCEAGQKMRTGLLQLKTVGSSSICQGMAVKWK